MIAHNSSGPHPVYPETYYDTLVVSQDRQLFSQFTSFLREFEPERTPFLADDLTTFSGNEKNLSQCDVLICDLRSASPAVELGAYAVDCVPAETLAVGLTSDHDIPQETLCRQVNLRFSGIINNRKGWLANWNQISAIKQAWHNPLMVSRIEEVPVSDVLQMIASGCWNVVVHVTGYGMSTLPLLPNKACKGCISFYQGVPQTAWSWKSAGIQAMFDLLSLKKGILQVVKNLCAPTIRNVYLQTDEVLLSHAVALDESIIPPPEVPPPAVAPVPATTSENSTWWTVNGQRIIETLDRAMEQSFPFRVMNSEGLTDLSRNQHDSAMVIVYGSTEELAGFFSRCARGFSAEKLTGEQQFPVMRLGRSGEPCLYITGCVPSSDLHLMKKVPAIVLQPAELDSATAERLIKRDHSAVFTIGPATLPTATEASSANGSILAPMEPLPDCSRSWNGYTTMLRSVLTRLMSRN